MNYEKYIKLKDVNAEIQKIIDSLILLERTPDLRLEIAVRKRLDAVFAKLRTVPVGLTPVPKPPVEVKSRIPGSTVKPKPIDRDFSCQHCGKPLYNYTAYTHHLSRCKGYGVKGPSSSPKTWYSDYTRRDNGKYGSFPDHDDYSEDSAP